MSRPAGPRRRRTVAVSVVVVVGRIGTVSVTVWCLPVGRRDAGAQGVQGQAVGGAGAVTHDLAARPQLLASSV